MSFSITIEERKIAFLDEDKNILNSLERENVESHFHCRDGFCGACRCTLKKGTVEYNEYPLAFIGAGEILTCCAYPTSDIVIEID
ncbi:2Fe-2S iron-sulfur cluster binding domain-containing protein [Colwellia sp. M166]|uniref:class I ribonucleotide reductase maintenance protein YfaE n=1 Tax=Colwellia sp. M166 TaxID=2583805 RepID=UPI00211DF743|nr:class I ribonucleotide reductase maintenance protein YfaE [Colwellia sp. M166]UUO22329.1 2Fe-2S iron-sulfur cluster binding domain-containing protein [Colwellia sp. M166]|tara:strand:- start:57130 stop:57384 length:255 start_codon:yes stop_codon:yes gene_type:complete